MRNILLLLLIGYSFILYPQSAQFIRKAKELVQVVDSTYKIEEIAPSAEVYDFFSEGNDRLAGIFLSHMKNIAKGKNYEIRNSVTLHTIAGLATECWKGSQYSNAKKWFNLQKYFRRALIKNTSGFNYMNAVSFRIPLVDSHGKRFYYDNHGPEGQLNLYAGKKPDPYYKQKKRKKVDEEVEPEPEPLTFFTEEELLARFDREIRRKSMISDLKRGRYSFIGLHIEIDKNSLHREKIPTARVVVIMGAKRLANVKVRREFDE